MDSRKLQLVDASEGIDHSYREAETALREAGLTDAADTVKRARLRLRRLTADIVAAVPSD